MHNYSTIFLTFFELKYLNGLHTVSLDVLAY